MQNVIPLVEANWPVALAALLVVVLAAWWLFHARRTTRVDTDRSDVLDDGKGPAARNQALIDAPPAAARVDSVAASAPAGGDDLTRIKGLGPKIQSMLHEQGITTFAQIAAWSEADIDTVDAQLGKFEGRIRRDNWVEQAGLLAQADTAAYEDRFGKL